MAERDIKSCCVVTRQQFLNSTMYVLSLCKNRPVQLVFRDWREFNHIPPSVSEIDMLADRCSSLKIFILDEDVTFDWKSHTEERKRLFADAKAKAGL